MRKGLGLMHNRFGLGHLVIMTFVLLLLMPHSALAQISQPPQILVGPNETYKDIKSAIKVAQPDTNYYFTETDLS